MDFRAVRVDGLRWFPQSKSVIPVTPVTVQTPPGLCAVTPGPSRYGVRVSCRGPAGAAFSQFVQRLEEHAQEHATAFLPGPRDFRSGTGDLRLTAFSDTLLFDARGEQTHDPLDFKACEALVQLTGAWVTDTAWGLRWKLLELKEADVPALAEPMRAPSSSVQSSVPSSVAPSVPSSVAPSVPSPSCIAACFDFTP